VIVLLQNGIEHLFFCIFESLLITTLLSTFTLLISGLLGIYWALKAQNPFTKACSLLVSFSCLSLAIPQATLQAYTPFFVAFACIISGFEPGNSRRLQQWLKVFFAAFGIIFAAIAVDRVIIWPFDFQFWPLVLVYFGILLWTIRKDKKKVRTRLGTLFAWTGLGIDCLLRLI